MSAEAFRKRFSALSDAPIEEQRDVFLKRFIFKLGPDGLRDVEKFHDEFKKMAAQKKEGCEELDLASAGVFLEKYCPGKRTATQRKNELIDVDENHNGMTCFVEMMLLFYKVMIFEDYYARKKVAPDVDLSNHGVGVTGVGDFLITELYSPPLGIDPKLEEMMENFSLEHSKRAAELEDLKTQVAAGGVKGMGAKTKLEKMLNEDSSAKNALEAKIAAAIKKADAKAAEELAKLRVDLKENAAKKPTGGAMAKALASPTSAAAPAAAPVALAAEEAAPAPAAVEGGKAAAACSNYQLDMKGATFGQCKCGWQKIDHKM